MKMCDTLQILHNNSIYITITNANNYLLFNNNKVIVLYFVIKYFFIIYYYIIYIFLLQIPSSYTAHNIAAILLISAVWNVNKEFISLERKSLQYIFYIATNIKHLYQCNYATCN